MVLAHVGHWSLWILYMIPVVVVLGSIVMQTVRDRRERRAGLDVGDAGHGEDKREADERQSDP